MGEELGAHVPYRTAPRWRHQTRRSDRFAIRGVQTTRYEALVPVKPRFPSQPRRILELSSNKVALRMRLHRAVRRPVGTDWTSPAAMTFFLLLLPNCFPILNSLIGG